MRRAKTLSTKSNLLDGLNYLESLKIISEMVIKSQNVTVKLAYGKGGLIAFLERIFRGTGIAER